MSRKDIIDATTGEIVTDVNGRTLKPQGRGNMYNNKSRQSYMEQENVKAFNRKVREHSFTKLGAPYAFNSIEEVENDLSDYFNACEENNIVPTITGIAVWLGCNRDTIYAHANNPNSIFSDIFKQTINYCHLLLENGTIDGKINPVTYIFMGKNYFSLEDNKNITVTPANNATINNSETMDALQKQIADENTPNADYQEM